ncbi:hypothetical protein [Deinococcus radiopugnans]|uniref:Uncharacterized protein n=1 Tax=Deinococcus radiopugnans ATCC 19172 TaxID=585398 RepID=A0A5C4Y8N7_9DEIO|nr:hypothetical protein [Deinococcus radiopugnans]MBB6016780.1 hypothetical protein [Deinococcus radiopugnans ATCC 19172]TNM71929.1 hypothetical protein FHR04_06060 [Deinococcus radiopugnans ATCC 19172]
MSPDERARLAELEEQVLVGASAALLAGRALTEIRDARLYRGEFASFEQYALARFGFSRPRAYQLIDYAAAAGEFAVLNLPLPPERITRALGGVLPEDYQIVLDVTRATTGKAHPSSADVQAVADVNRAMAEGAHIEHPDTGKPVPYSSLPPKQRGPALATAVRRGSQDRRDFQGTDDVKPVDWLDDLRSLAQVELLGTVEGWQVIATDRSSGERREGPVRKTFWDAIRHARAMWEGERDRAPE